ncbi:HNH endonuclease [Bdellovibrio bacteriovorus]|uniref:HNH endonuclease n=1 Tax=Bdellovibrio bacteriovorus TaxID=959 RepID=UPI0035A67AB1
MDLSKISNSELIVRLEKLTRTERKITHVILCHINEVESRRIYADLGFDSMYKYLTQQLGYGEDSAYRRLQAARLLKQAPQVAEKLENGSLNLTQLTQVQKCLKQEIKEGRKVDLKLTQQVLEKIENKTSFETAKCLAKEFNQSIQTQEVVKSQKDNSVRLEVTFTEEQMEVLMKAKDSLSHVLPDGDWTSLFLHLATKQLKKEHGKKSSLKDANSTQSFTAQRKHIKITLKRELLHKANHCCEFVSPTDGKKCESTYQLQIDHRIPLARGGTNNPDNLRVLCRTHNLYFADKWGLLAK